MEHYRGAEVFDQFATEDAIWELMYFGHADRPRGGRALLVEPLSLDGTSFVC